MEYLTYLEKPSLWWTLLGIFSSLYVGTPCLIRFIQKFRRNFTLVEFKPHETPLPGNVTEFFQDNFEQLKSIDFQLKHHYLLNDLVPNVTAIFALYENPIEGDAAIVVVMYGFADDSKSDVALQEHYVEFSTVFQNGEEVSTKNSKQESAFKPVARRTLTQIPITTDLSVLYAVHKRLTERFGTPPKSPLPLPGEWHDMLKKDMMREFTEQLETGYLYLNFSQDFFVPTWLGACMMTWAQLFPIVHFRRAMIRRNARRLMEEFNIR